MFKKSGDIWLDNCAVHSQIYCTSEQLVVKRKDYQGNLY